VEPGAEAEGVRVGVHLNLREAGRSQPLREAARIDGNHGVEKVEQAKREAVEAIGAGENCPGPEHAGDFGEQAILHRRRRHVVEHGEADCVRMQTTVLHKG